MATIRNKEISKTGGVCLSFVAVLAIAAATLFTSGKPVEELSENAAVGRKSVITAAGATLPLPFYSEAFKSTGRRTTSLLLMPVSVRNADSEA